MYITIFIHRMSYTGFQLVLKVATLNDLEWHNGHYFAFFTEFGWFGGHGYSVLVNDYVVDRGQDWQSCFFLFVNKQVSCCEGCVLKHSLFADCVVLFVS